MNKKISSILKYILVFSAGFLTNFSGFLDNVTKIPNSYKEFKKEYLYDKVFLDGDWSTDAEYILNSGDMGLNVEQPVMTMRLSVGDDGEVIGGILSKEICDALPITWVISIGSKAPNLSNLLLDRRFFVKQLHGGEMEVVAELKLVSEDKNNNSIKLKRVSDTTGAIPEYIYLGKNLPKFKENINFLEKYCADSSKRFFKDAINKENNSNK